MARKNDNSILVPEARQRMEQFKYEVASELAYMPPEAAGQPEGYRQALDNLKFEVARELGIQLVEGYNGELTTRAAGAIGGRIGGPIGGQMVKRMIALAEEELARSSR